MKLHISKFLFAAALASGMTACSDSFLDKASPNSISQDTYWKTENDALMAMAACYDAMQSDNLYDDYVDGWSFGFLMRETCTDNGGHDGWGDWQLGTNIAKGTGSTTEDCFRFYWTANYEWIKRCNVLIANIDRVPISQEKRDAYRAEAMALRALAYNNLTSMYRDVPYITEPLTLEKCASEKTPKADIVNSLIADLKANNSKMLPNGQADKGRLTQEGANAILGRIALYNGKWDDAIEAYKQVIGKYQLYKSGDGSDYARNYAEMFTREGEDNCEVMLAVHFVGPGKKEGSTSSIGWGGPMNAINASANLADDYYCTDGLPISDKGDAANVYAGRVSPLFLGSGRWQDGDNWVKDENGAIANPVTLDKFNAGYFANRDPRMPAVIFTPNMTWEGKNIEQLGIINGSCSSGTWIRKWFVEGNQANEYDGYLDFYVIRYAEVLLSLAEALNEKGAAQAEITPYINEVRARVGMPSVESVEGTGLSKEKLRQIIRHERRIELAFEDLRMADLYRWNEWDNSIAVMQAETKNYMSHWGVYTRGVAPNGRSTVWPIPQAEINSNPLLEQHDEWK